MATSIVKLFSRSCAHKYRFNNRHVGCRPLSGVTKEYGNDTADTDIARLKPSLRRRLKHLPPIRDEDVPPEDRTKNHGDRNYGPAIDYFKRDKISNFDSKLYAKFGAASKVNPSSLWPSETVIERELAKQQFCKPVAERIQDMKAEKLRLKNEMDDHQRKISRNMAKMDEYLDQYENRKKKRFMKDTEQINRRQKLLDEAREFFGYDVSHRDLKFQQMVEWKEEQEKKAKKLQKKQSKAGYLAQKVAKLTADLNTGSSDDPS